MVKCWKTDPVDRVRFSEITDLLSEYETPTTGGFNRKRQLFLKTQDVSGHDKGTSGCRSDNTLEPINVQSFCA